MMTSRIILFTLVFLPNLLSAQLLADRTTCDFGTIENFNNDTAYFTLSNTGTKTIYLLSTQPKSDYAILCSSKSIEPGNSIRLGIVYYTGEKGRFDLKVPLYFSHSADAITFNLKGHIKSVAETAFTICPSIENSKPLKAKQQPLSVIVKDADTKEMLGDVHIVAKNKNTETGCVPGLYGTTYRCACDYGTMKISASKDGYEDNQQIYSYSADNNICIIFLSKQVPSEVNDSLLPEEPETVVKKETLRYQKKSDSTTTVLKLEKKVTYIPASENDSGFNSYKYKPNHLIFIVDISKSMKDTFKLNYLKHCMKELISQVRPQDHITLITYASKVRIVMENVSGIDKSGLLTAIDTLKAGGGSNGAHSIEIAYDLAKKHFIEGGNNQIFLATDGLFNSNKLGEDDLYKMARKGFNQEAIILSGIGFGHDEKAIDFLEKLAKCGHGNFLLIKSIENDLQILVDEVKKQSTIK